MFAKKNKKQIVGLCITPNLGLEVLLYGDEQKEVLKYSQKFIEYNIATRSILDINAFRNALVDLFAELDIQKETANIFLVLPNVYSGFRSIEETYYDNEAIDTIVLEETAQSYIFKQEEPLCAWTNVNAGTAATSKYILYSAMQTNAVNEIQDAIMDIGGTIIGIESAVSAIPRGLALTGLCDDVIEGGKNWDIVLINSNNYAIFQMSGSRILDYVEVPFAVMSFEGDEIYSALSSALSQYLPNYPAEKLVLVSQVDNVSANILKNAIVFDETVVTFNSNRFSTAPQVSISAEVIKQTAASMSLGALGAANPKVQNFANLNIMGSANYDGNTSYGTIKLFGKDVELTASNVLSTSIKLSVLLGIVGGIFTGLAFSALQADSSKLEAKNADISTINMEIQQMETTLKTSIVTLIKEISENNKQSINYYDSLSTDIPSNVWLTYYINKNGKEVGIEGLSINMNDVYSYYQSLKMLAPQSDIKLNKLDVFREDQTQTGNDIDAIVLNENNAEQTFAFEISNTTYEKTFDDKGNKKTAEEGKEGEGAASSATKVPKVPDVDPNLKEAK